jgi:integrase
MLEFAITGKPRTLGRRQYGLVLMFVVFGGVRLEETVRLKWEDLQKNDDGLWEITVSEEDSKTDRKVNAFAEKPSTWIDQFIALIEETEERHPDNPIITQSRDISAAIDEDEIKQRQKRFRHAWKEHCDLKEDARWEDQKTVAQNGLRHAGACYGFHIYGQDELMNRMGDRDAKLLERAYRKYVKKSEAIKFFNVSSLAIRQDRNQQVQDMMALADVYEADAIKLLKGETLVDGRWFADGEIWTSNNNG